MDITAKRIFRLSLVIALSLAGAYALQLQLPYMAPVFGFMLTAAPSPPMKLKGLITFSILLSITLGLGLLYIPLLIHYPITALLLVTVGLFFSNHLSINRGQAAVGSLLTVGITIISATGLISFSIAQMIIESMMISFALALFCLWIVYPFFPEKPSAKAKKKPAINKESSLWAALRATLIVLPTYFLALTNPMMYLPIILKAVSLGQQDSISNAHNAGKELLGSTFLGGFFAIIFWFALKIHPNLWMFFLWTLLFSLYLSCKFYQLIKSNLPPSFWKNVIITLFILLGPAVEDSATGKDVYKAFAVRMALFIAVTLYAWMAIIMLDYLHRRNRRKAKSITSTTLELK